MLENALLIQQALKLVREKSPILSQISTTFVSGTYKQDDTVQAHVYAKPSVKDLKASGLEADELSPTTMPVKLDQMKALTYKVPYKDINTTRIDLINDAASLLAETLGEHFVKAALEIVTKENYSVIPPVIATTANTDAETLSTCRKLLVENKASRARFGIVDPATFAALTNDPILGNANTNPQGGDAVLDGVIHRAKGFDIYEYPEMPSGLAGFFAGKEAILFAAGAPADPSRAGAISGGGNFDIFTDSDSGITVLGQEFVDQKTLDTYLRLIFLYGRGTGVKTSGVRLLTAAES